MKVKLNKDKFTAIDGAFLVLKEDKNNNAALSIIKNSLEDCFDCKFIINVIDPVDKNSPLFIMSVFPEISVVDKIISSIMTESETKTIQKLWETNKVWNIEIDARILDNTVIECTDKELTAILLHEIGHIICSTSIPNRVSLILRYEIMKSNISNKMMLKDKVFRKIMSLPILDTCISDGKRDKTTIKEEVKADAFAKKMGYSTELQSVLTKLMNSKLYSNSNTINDKIVKNADLALNTLDEFQQRRDQLAKKRLLSLREACTSPYISNVLDEFIETVFNDVEDSLSLINGRKVEYMQERADKVIEDGYYTEFFSFRKELKRIDPAEIDYIYGKINSIKNENDRMMVISYIHSKLDLVEYYISIMKNEKVSKKYDIPHSLNQLEGLRQRLLELRQVALKFKIPEKNKGILVAWPTGYEG